MSSLPPVVWVIVVLAILLVLVRIWARRVEQEGKRPEERERLPRSLDQERSRRSGAHSKDAPRSKDGG